MPNWCYNKLQITGSKADIKKFRLKAEGHQQNYNEFSGLQNGKWPIHDDIRLESLVASPPEPGDIVKFSFHALVPVPEDFRCFPYDDTRARELGELVGIPRPYGGYNWESLNWGVKWGACDSVLVNEEDFYLEYEFNTAWGPPGVFMEKVAELFPNLHFELGYSEPGMGFCGQMIFEEGSLVHEDYNEYHEEEEE